MSNTAVRSKVVIQDSNREPVVGVAAQLLGVLGHEVAIVDTPEAAVEAASHGPTDLLVLSVADFDEQRRRLDEVALLPRSRQPRQVAILSDAEAEEGAFVRRSLSDVKVHVFVKPVHALGLIGVIKRMPGVN